MTGPATQPATQGGGIDPAALLAGVADRFMAFLTGFSPDDYQPPTPGPHDDPATPVSFVARTIKEMADDNDTVLYVDFDHLSKFDYELAERVSQHYERLEPVLRDTLRAYIRAHHPESLREAHGPEKEFFVGLYDLATTERLRTLRTEHIGKLTAFSGTVTRTSDVRPELFLGTFRCAECGTEVRNVEQFYKFTEPMVCPNQACNNKCVRGWCGVCAVLRGGRCPGAGCGARDMLCTHRTAL
jgi:DNA replication licensing factor MCM6